MLVVLMVVAVVLVLLRFLLMGVLGPITVAVAGHDGAGGSNDLKNESTTFVLASVPIVAGKVG